MNKGWDNEVKSNFTLRSDNYNIKFVERDILSLAFFLFLLSVFFINFIQITSADVISINSGGSNELIINPGGDIEGFFTGNVVSGSICGNSIVETGEQCDDGNVVDGDGCSSVCLTETVTPPADGGGGGGGGDVVTQTLLVTPTQFSINLAVNTNQQESISVTNLGTSATTIYISQENLNDLIILNTSAFVLQPGETRVLSVTFVAPSEAGIFTGIIHIGNQNVLVSFSVKTKLLLFDSNIVVLNEDYKVIKGDDLMTRVTLIPLGDRERMDVTLDYTIQDYLGKVYLTKKETLLIDERIQFDRNFDTGNLPAGKYIVGLQLTYPGGLAPSTAYFEVVKKAPITFGTIVLWLVMLIVILIIAILIIIIYRRRKKKEEENPEQV